MRAALDAGYNAWGILARSRHLDALRDRPDFRELVALSEERRRANTAAFRAAGGESLLGTLAGALPA
jgi:hypothetical protein